MSTSSVRAGRAPVTLRVPFAASSVSIARQKLKTWLVDAGVRRDAIDDARVVISELVANSVRHAQALPDGDIVVSWHMTDKGLQISVTDGGSGTRPRKVNRPLVRARGPWHGHRGDARGELVGRPHPVEDHRPRAAGRLTPTQSGPRGPAQ